LSRIGRIGHTAIEAVPDRQGFPRGTTPWDLSAAPPVGYGAPMDDVDRLRTALADVEASARMLRWSDRRPWTVRTHVHWSGDLPEIDLHDLDARHAREAVRAATTVRLQTGAVRFVTGRGRHSRGPGVLGPVVRGELRRIGEGRGWRVRPAGPARWLLVTDVDRAPAAATGELGWGMRLLFLAFLVAAVVALARAAGWI